VVALKSKTKSKGTKKKFLLKKRTQASKLPESVAGTKTDKKPATLTAKLLGKTSTKIK